MYTHLQMNSNNSCAVVSLLCYFFVRILVIKQNHKKSSATANWIASAVFIIGKEAGN